MKFFSRRFLIGAYLILLLTSACNLPAQSPPAPIGTILPTGQATSTLDFTTPTSLIPVTGQGDVVSLQCQFCINDEVRAVVVMPEQATFLVSDPIVGVSCLTAQVVNGDRIVFCRGLQQTSFTLNSCVDNSNCSQSRITFETCPAIPQTGMNTPQVIFTPTSVLVQVPTEAMTSAPPVTLTVTSTLQPGSTPFAREPVSGLNDPAGFVRWYFEAVWKNRNYQDLWDNYLTTTYKANVGSGLYEDYVRWWESVEQVEIHSVDVLENDGTNVEVRVNATFHMRDRRVVSNQSYEYNLLYDANRSTWMFDF